jgi:hypothetical protein
VHPRFRRARRPRLTSSSISDFENAVIVAAVDETRLADMKELEQVLARYALGMTQDDVEAVMDVFTPDGTYSAFGETYTLTDFPSLVAAAPKGLFLTGTPVLELEEDTGTGAQTLCFVDQTTHEMRIGWYTDTYRKTEQGWRLRTRKMTFLRRNGARDSGKPHDPTRPRPSEEPAG